MKSSFKKKAQAIIASIGTLSILLSSVLPSQTFIPQAEASNAPANFTTAVPGALMPGSAFETDYNFDVFEDTLTIFITAVNLSITNIVALGCSIANQNATGATVSCTDPAGPTNRTITTSTTAAQTGNANFSIQVSSQNFPAQNKTISTGNIPIVSDQAASIGPFSIDSIAHDGAPDGQVQTGITISCQDPDAGDTINTFQIQGGTPAGVTVTNDTGNASNNRSLTLSIENTAVTDSFLETPFIFECISSGSPDTITDNRTFTFTDTAAALAPPAQTQAIHNDATPQTINNSVSCSDNDGIDSITNMDITNVSSTPAGGSIGNIVFPGVGNPQTLTYDVISATGEPLIVSYTLECTSSGNPTQTLSSQQSFTFSDAPLFSMIDTSDFQGKLGVPISQVNTEIIQNLSGITDVDLSITLTDTDDLGENVTVSINNNDAANVVPVGFPFVIAPNATPTITGKLRFDPNNAADITGTLDIQFQGPHQTITESITIGSSGGGRRINRTTTRAEEKGNGTTTDSPEKPLTEEERVLNKNQFDRPSEPASTVKNGAKTVTLRYPIIHPSQKALGKTIGEAFKFFFSWHRIIKKGRLRIGSTVSNEPTPPKYFQGDNDITDKGILSPITPGVFKDSILLKNNISAASPSAKPTKFAFEAFTKDPEITTIDWAFMIDLDASGHYQSPNIDGKKETIAVGKSAVAAGGKFNINFDHTFEKLDFANAYGLYCRFVIKNGNKNIKSEGPSEGIISGALMPSSAMKEDLERDGTFGSFYEGEAETYLCISDPDENAQEAPSEPEERIPNPTKTNQYHPEKLLFKPHNDFYLGHQKGQADPILVFQQRLDDIALSFHSDEPHTSHKDDEPNKDDRDGIVRSGNYNTTDNITELTFNSGQQNVIEITVTDITGHGTTEDPGKARYINIFIDKQADGKYLGKERTTFKKGSRNDWVLQNHIVRLEKITQSFDIPFFLEKTLKTHPKGTYMRVTITDHPANPKNRPWDASSSAFDSELLIGESESYLVNFQARDQSKDNKKQRRSKEGDRDGDGIPDNTEGDEDWDGDGLSNKEDIDSDGDGIQDSEEAGNNPLEPRDTDGSGIPDYLDTDSDADNIPDISEGNTDDDKDGTPNYLDVDSNNDEVLDIHETNQFPNTIKGTIQTAPDTNNPQKESNPLSFNFTASKAPKTTQEITKLKLNTSNKNLIQANIENLEGYKESSFSSYILKAVELGLIQGKETITTDGKRNAAANDPLLRAHLACILFRALGYESTEINSDPFSDLSADHWSAKCFQALKNEGILISLNEKVYPSRTVNMAELLTILARVSNITTNKNRELSQKISREFKGVSSDSWYMDGVIYGVLSGFIDESETAFDGDELLNRGKAIKIIIEHLLPYIGVFE